MNYDVFKSLHIIFVVCWFAGLFYIVRLFIYHREAFDKEAVEREVLHKQYQIMESRLLNVITTPAMILTIIFGTIMLYLNPFYLSQPWMHIKLSFVLLLVIYHLRSVRIHRQLKEGNFNWSSNQLRMWNELPTLFLVSIVFLVVLKTSFNWIMGTVGFFAVGILLMMGIKIYKRFRK